MSNIYKYRGIFIDNVIEKRQISQKESTICRKRQIFIDNVKLFVGNVKYSQNKNNYL